MNRASLSYSQTATECARSKSTIESVIQRHGNESITGATSAPPKHQKIPEPIKEILSVLSIKIDSLLSPKLPNNCPRKYQYELFNVASKKLEFKSILQ